MRAPWHFGQSCAVSGRGNAGRSGPIFRAEQVVTGNPLLGVSRGGRVVDILGLRGGFIASGCQHIDVVQKLCYLNIHGQTIYRVHAHFAAMNSELVLTWPLDLEERHA
jgi:hypothetical protein